MMSFLFPQRERQQQQQQLDDEEGAALQLVPPLDDDDDHGGGAADDHENPIPAAVKQQLDDDDDKTTEERQAITSSKQAAWWRRRAQQLVPTRSVGLVIPGLVVLALLVGSTSSWWIHLDYASDGFAGNGAVVQSRDGTRRQTTWLARFLEISRSWMPPALS